MYLVMISTYSDDLVVRQFDDLAPAESLAAQIASDESFCDGLVAEILKVMGRDHSDSVCVYILRLSAARTAAEFIRKDEWDFAWI